MTEPRNSDTSKVLPDLDWALISKSYQKWQIFNFQRPKCNANFITKWNHGYNINKNPKVYTFPHRFFEIACYSNPSRISTFLPGPTDFNGLDNV